MPVEPGGVVYGTITIGALLAAESARSETYPKTVLGVLIALLLYWLAHSYASLTADRVRAAAALTIADLGRTMARELSLLLGAAVPLLALLVWWAAGASLGAAVSAAVWASAAMILLIEAAIGVRAGLHGRALLAQVGLGALLGLLVIVLKVVLH